MIFLRNSSPVMDDENMPNVPSVADLWPSADVVAQQSVSVIVLKPVSRKRHTRAGGDEASVEAMRAISVQFRAQCRYPFHKPCASWTQRNSS